MSCYSYRFAHTMMGIKNVDNTMIQIIVFCVIKISENEVFKDIPKKKGQMIIMRMDQMTIVILMRNQLLLLK